jgi:hypothetical protein
MIDMANPLFVAIHVPVGCDQLKSRGDFRQDTVTGSCAFMIESRQAFPLAV